MDVEALLKMVGGPRDSALLRLSIARELLREGRAHEACAHMAWAVEAEPAYTAAWKVLGQAALAAGDPERARTAWTQGCAVASAAGDIQAGKEMAVFLRRLDKAAKTD